MNRNSALALIFIFIAAGGAWAFTQSGVATAIGFGIPMGHEWITRLAGVEVIDRLPYAEDDPRKGWGPQGRAKNPDVSSPEARSELARITAPGRRTEEDRYRSKYTAVFDAIIGERWVDAAGFNVAKSHIHEYNCWDAVAQEPPEIQYDHFMRRYDDRDATGGVDAMQRSQARFKDYFAAAATASPSRLIVWDGGAFSAQYEVDRNYFLFGRAVHLFEDSFSPEHTVRVADDNYESVRQVKAYLCSTGAEQHAHVVPTFKDFTSRDVIWKDGTNLELGWPSYKAANMRPAPLVSTEATRDLWAAFIRTMGTPMAQRRGVAEREADLLIRNWLDGNRASMLTWYDDEQRRDGTYVWASGQTGKGVSVAQCMNTVNLKWRGSQMAAVNALAIEQRICLFNVAPVTGYSDLFDPSLHMPFNWDWQWNDWRKPDSTWQIPNRPADTGTRFVLRSQQNGQYVTVPDGLRDGSMLRARPGEALSMTRVGDSGQDYYRATFAPWLFVSYNADYRGQLKLYAGVRVGDVWVQRPTKDAEFKMIPKGPDVAAIFGIVPSQYVWLYEDELQLNKWGNPDEVKARWVFVPAP